MMFVLLYLYFHHRRVKNVFKNELRNLNDRLVVLESDNVELKKTINTMKDIRNRGLQMNGRSDNRNIHRNPKVLQERK